MIIPVDYLLKFDKEFYYPIKSRQKESTIRINSKPLDIGDYVVAYFPELKKGLLVEIMGHYAKRLKDLSHKEAKCEGYYHPDLLKHELHNIYPNLDDDAYVYFYRFDYVNPNHPEYNEGVINNFLKGKGVELE